MKFHILSAICAVFTLAFFGCAKKQAVSKTEIVPSESAETVSAVQSETESSANAAVAQETQIAKDGFDAWSDEEAYALAVLMKRPKEPDGSAMPGENPRTAGLFIFTYHEGDTIIAPTSREGRYFSFFKSTDGATWKRIELPLDTEKYKAARVLSMSMDGNYGYVEVGAELRDESDKSYEKIYFATKDGDETWVLWNNKRKMFVI